MSRQFFASLALLALPSHAAQIEILRDRWGVPHIFAGNTEDLFYAQGYMAARDRLFQLDLWRRQNTGHLAEILGESAIPRDRIARLVRYRGDWDAEWKSYHPETKKIATAFVDGINHYIKTLKKRPVEFEIAGYDPALWQPEDVTARIAGLLMTHNAGKEVQRVLDIKQFGLETVQRVLPTDPMVTFKIPNGLDLSLVSRDILRDYQAAIATPRFDPAQTEQGSNNWVIDGTMSATGKPLLASDPHRPVILPSLRKTWHLVAPGWNAIGAGEPALPGIALGHNQNIAWGFTIAYIDQQDLYVEKLNPANPNQYRFKGSWRDVEIEHQTLGVKGRGAPVDIELRYTIHGPILYEDRARNAAYALKWVGADPGGAGYLPALSLMQAKNWDDFRKSVASFKVPSENLIYADTQGNIGWIAAGLSPVRKNWPGLMPVPGEEGEYEWDGYLKIDEVPQSFNPPRHFIATANNNILPAGYAKQFSYEFGPGFRADRITQTLASRRDWDRISFERLQYDVVSLPAKRFQSILRQWTPPEGDRAIVNEILQWDAQVRADSHAALIYEQWIARLSAAVFGPALGGRVSLETTLKTLEKSPNAKALEDSLHSALSATTARKWGELHTITFRHPLGKKEWSRGPYPRPGDSTTVHAASGPNFRQASGASYRQVIDVSNWDHSVMTNVPGESGDPASPHYDDLIKDWLSGQYHPMPFTRKFVEANTTERFILTHK